MTTTTVRKSIKPPASFTCIYWNGGVKRGRWQQTANGSREYADKLCAETERMGYRAKVVDVESLKHGLPVTRHPSEHCSDWELRRDGFYHWIGN